MHTICTCIVHIFTIFTILLLILLNYNLVPALSDRIKNKKVWSHIFRVAYHSAKKMAMDESHKPQNR